MPLGKDDMRTQTHTWNHSSLMSTRGALYLPCSQGDELSLLPGGRSGDHSWRQVLSTLPPPGMFEIRDSQCTDFFFTVSD